MRAEPVPDAGVSDTWSGGTAGGGATGGATGGAVVGIPDWVGCDSLTGASSNRLMAGGGAAGGAAGALLAGVSWEQASKLALVQHRQMAMDHFMGVSWAGVAETARHPSRSKRRARRWR